MQPASRKDLYDDWLNATRLKDVSVHQLFIDFSQERMALPIAQPSLPSLA